MVHRRALSNSPTGSSSAPTSSLPNDPAAKVIILFGDAVNGQTSPSTELARFHLP